MNTMLTWWIILVVGPLVAGAALAGMLAAPRAIERALLLPGAAAASFAVTSFGTLTNHYQRLDATLYALAFMIAAAAGGYALVSTSLGYLAPRNEPRELMTTDAPADHRPVVVLSACIEPAVYSARSTADLLQQLSEEDLLETSVGVLPFVFFSQKTRYHTIGGKSPSETQLRSLAEQLESALSARSALVEYASCAGEHRTSSVVAAAVARGHRRIVTVQLPISAETSMIAALDELTALNAGAAGVRLTNAGCVGSSERVLKMLARRVSDSAGELPHDTGVVVVCHGQPDERAQTNPSYDADEAMFANRLRMLLVEQGFEEDRIRMAWLEWHDPDVTSAVRHLAALGCGRVLVCPAAFPLESLATRIDLEAAVRKAHTDDDVTISVLPAWRDDPAVVEALRAAVIHALDEE